MGTSHSPSGQSEKILVTRRIWSLDIAAVISTLEGLAVIVPTAQATSHPPQERR